MLAKNLATSVFLVVLLVQRIISLTMLPKAKVQNQEVSAEPKGKREGREQSSFQDTSFKKQPKEFLKGHIFDAHISSILLVLPRTPDFIIRLLISVTGLILLSILLDT